ncbi:MAG: hypothetical protein IPP90_07985 [Gemmatimonadaceae bacterium]|nr:hypothetical protein [Gemmatimonadaceae bacterium]
MMTLGMPLVFTGAIAGALAITALHLLSVRRPPELWLPTARFLPERTVRAISRTRHPSDVWLLLLRIVALLLAGLAAAAPRWQGGSGARVVLVVRDAGVTDDSLAMRAIVTSADTGAPRAARFIFAAADSSDGARDELGVLFPVAWRAAGRIARDAPTDSIDLHLLLSQAPIAHDAEMRLPGVRRGPGAL